jgi:hypothetical protein
MSRDSIVRPIVFALCATAMTGCSNHGSAPPGLPTLQSANSVRHASVTVDTVYTADITNYTFVTATDGSGTFLRQILDGVETTASVAVDSSSNLYVGMPGTVVVYAPGSPVPSGFYDINPYMGVSGIANGMVVDGGKLYVAVSLAAGWKGGQSGDVLVYQTPPVAGGKATPSQILVTPPGTHPTAVTLDHQGNVYVEVLTGLTWPFPGYVYEYPAGTIVGKKLPLTLRDDSGSSTIAFDAQGNLIVCDDYANTIDIFPPGAAKPMRTISGMKGCDAFALSSDKTTLYATGQPHQSQFLGPGAVINKFDYASGSLEGTITSGFDPQNSRLTGLAVDPPAPF